MCGWSYLKMGISTDHEDLLWKMNEDFFVHAKSECNPQDSMKCKSQQGYHEGLIEGFGEKDLKENKICWMVVTIGLIMALSFCLNMSLFHIVLLSAIMCMVYYAVNNSEMSERPHLDS